MKKTILVVFSIAVFGGLSAIQAQNGFIVWSKGGGCDRELYYNPVTDGNKVGEEKLVIKKGEGADIWPHISYDGEWVAWARATSAFKGKYGQCDYHKFQNFDIYIGKINFGKTLPVEGIKVAHGYLPSWAMDDNAKTPNKPKMLYFTHFESKTIKKTTINPDGTFSEPVEHEKFEQKMGHGSHIQCSPDGKFLLYRPYWMRVYSFELEKDIIDEMQGCHPCWGPRSKYCIISRNSAYFNTGTSVKSLGKAGVGEYFQGLSNDAYWDEGRLWVIGPIGGGQNGAGKVQFKEVAISNDGKWELGESIEVGKGSACDIHMFPADFDPDKPTSVIPKSWGLAANRIAFTTQINTAASGVQLLIYPLDRTGKTAELFDLQGERVDFINMSNSGVNIMPLNNIVNGRYILKVSGNDMSTLESIFIAR